MDSEKYAQDYTDWLFRPVKCSNCRQLDENSYCHSPLYKEVGGSGIKINHPNNPEPCSGYREKE